jgi:hypothetical protein
MNVLDLNEEKMRTAAAATAATAVMQPVLHSFAYSLNYLREQVADVRADEMVAQPNGIMNHPAWVVGHLTYTCQLLGGVIGISEWLPNDWAERYGTGSAPQADSRLYETKDELLKILADAQSRINKAVERLDEAELNAPFPDESYLEVFPTIRHALTQVLVGHTANHVGQVSLWRRAMGLPPMRRSFE